MYRLILGRGARYAAKKHNDKDTGSGQSVVKGKKAISGCRLWNLTQWRCPTEYDLRVESALEALYKKTAISAKRGSLIRWPYSLNFAATPYKQVSSFSRVNFHDVTKLRGSIRSTKELMMGRIRVPRCFSQWGKRPRESEFAVLFFPNGI